MRIGITGNIGSGKTTLARELSEGYGIDVYYTDDRAKYLLMNKKPLIRLIKKVFGKSFYNYDGTINKEFVYEMMKDDDLFTKYENIVHKYVEKDYKNWLKTASLITIKESALIFEKDLDKDLDFILFCKCSEQTRIKRVLSRDSGRTVEQLDLIMKRQYQDDVKEQLADYVFDNEVEDSHLKYTTDIHLLINNAIFNKYKNDFNRVKDLINKYQEKYYTIFSPFSLHGLNYSDTFAYGIYSNIFLNKDSPLYNKNLFGKRIAILEKYIKDNISILHPANYYNVIRKKINKTYINSIFKCAGKIQRPKYILDSLFNQLKVLMIEIKNNNNRSNISKDTFLRIFTKSIGCTDINTFLNYLINDNIAYDQKNIEYIAYSMYKLYNNEQLNNIESNYYINTIKPEIEIIKREKKIKHIKNII